ncbi:MAG: YceI family protein [Bdellovibrionales bacterium]|nr:YceI family protein [Bdellovibrionales bacterium]
MIKTTLLFFVLAFISQVQAAEWRINRDHSEVLFQVPYLSLSEVSGRFKDLSGSVEFNENNHPKTIMVKLDTASVDTGNSLRDGHLRANDFFQSKQYPHIIFKSQSVKELRPGFFQARGDLTIKSIIRPFTIDFSISETVKEFLLSSLYLFTPKIFWPNTFLYWPGNSLIL